MKYTHSSNLVTTNKKGKATDIQHSIELSSELEAIKHFDLVRERLLMPQLWHTLAGTFTASFKLIDKTSLEINTLAKSDDYIRIDIPGPGPSAGGSFDWVQIQDIRMNCVEGTNESVSIQLKPSASPVGESTAHFFAEDASSTFIIQRESNIVKAFYYGRNEVPNVENVSLLDKIRNFFVGTAAIAGVSELQWTALIKGLLKPEES